MLKNTFGPFVDYFDNSRYCTKYSYKQYSWLQAQFRLFPGNLVYDLHCTDVKEVEQLVSRVKNREIPNEIWVEDIPENQLAIRELELAGAKLWVKYPAMHLELQKLKAPEVRDSSVQIKLVRTPEDLEKWAELIIRDWWQGSPERVTQLVQVYQDLIADPSKLRMYLAEINGKAVGTSLGIISGQMIGLFLIFTHMDYRNRGIGKLLTVQPALDALQLGCTDAVLQATEEGEVIYRQLGFVELFKYKIYGFNELI